MTDQLAIGEGQDSVEEERADSHHLPGMGQLSMVDEIESVEADVDEARERSKEWIGLPAFADVRPPARVVISFECERDRDAFFAHVGIKTVHKGTRGTLSVWYPDKPKEDLSSLKFVIEDITG